MITNETLRVKESLNWNINIMNWMIADVFKIMQKQVWKNYKRDNLSISLSKFDKHNSDFISVKDWAYFISKSWLVIEREIIGCTQSAQLLCISFYWGEDTQKKWVNILDPMIRFNPFEKYLGTRNCLRKRSQLYVWKRSTIKSILHKWVARVFNGHSIYLYEDEEYWLSIGGEINGY